MSKQKTTVQAHKHFKMGTAGTYRMIGIWSQPSQSLLTANPNAYNRQMDGRPKCCQFACHHCGYPIMHHYMIRDDAGNDFSVGSECIAKLNDTELTTAAKKMKLEKERLARKAKRDEEARIKREAKEAELNAQRERNGGLTDIELKNEQRMERVTELEFERRVVAKPVSKLLKQNGSDFCKSIISGFRLGHTPRGRGEELTIEIMAKQMSGARKGSKAYYAALEEAETLYNDTMDKIKALK
ncbi:conserved hypothetical protein [Vibrio chagasii]|nr:conserved hypothetical protein [Vibrio chagasii]